MPGVSKKQNKLKKKRTPWLTNVCRILSQEGPPLSIFNKTEILLKTRVKI